MELQLKNIGMIKEAIVKIDGLTVIAGENDTGKSTVGKALFMFFKTYHFFLKATLNIRAIKKDKTTQIESFFDNNKKEINEFANFPYLIFQTDINGAEATILDNHKNFSLKVEKDNLIYPNIDNFKIVPPLNPIFIESPLIWNVNDFFRDIAQIESEFELKLNYPYLMKDLNFKLYIKSASKGLDIKKKVTDLMGGELKRDKMGRYYFDKQGQRIELINTSTGIKSFGIFQVLSQNNYLNENTVLVLDEPEVHLHPKWQLEMAKIIVELVKNGVKIVVNSHSPYMIDALKYYADEYRVNSNFYLAEKNSDETSTISNVTMDISPIFEKLTEPLRELRKMKLGLK